MKLPVQIKCDSPRSDHVSIYTDNGIDLRELLPIKHMNIHFHPASPVAAEFDITISEVKLDRVMATMNFNDQETKNKFISVLIDLLRSEGYKINASIQCA